MTADFTRCGICSAELSAHRVARYEIAATLLGSLGHAPIRAALCPSCADEPTT